MFKLGEWFDKLRKRASKSGFGCDICKAELFDYPTHRICSACKEALLYNDGHTCAKCGRKGVTEGVCLSCKSHVPAFDIGASPFVYRGMTASLVNRIKNGERRLAYFFGEELAQCCMGRFPELKTQFDIGRYALNEETAPQKLLILPVPLTEERRYERGYNQSREIALVFTDELNRLGISAELDEETLIKRRETLAQKKLGYAARMQNAAGAYHVHKRKFCKDRTIILIDDIMTTGATGGECARVLKHAGAKTVYFLTLASLPENKK